MISKPTARRIEIIREFFQRARIATEKLDWLDIGCGRGDLLSAGRQCFKSAAGCDSSDEMLKPCKDLDVRHQLSIESLPFDDAAFDFITTACVYQHVPPDLRPVLARETLRVLRPGGVFCVIEHNPLNWQPRRIPNAKLLRAHETGRLVSDAGYKIVETRFFFLFPERLHRLTRPLENTLRAFPFGRQYAIFSRRRV
jgi:ubiquinone/menaquinone biosynthesis C-methylase UbiE